MGTVKGERNKTEQRMGPLRRTNKLSVKLNQMYSERTEAQQRTDKVPQGPGLPTDQSPTFVDQPTSLFLLTKRRGPRPPRRQTQPVLVAEQVVQVVRRARTAQTRQVRAGNRPGPTEVDVGRPGRPDGHGGPKGRGGAFAEAQPETPGREGTDVAS